MNKRTLEAELIHHIEGSRFDNGDKLHLPGLKKVISFSEVGMLTRNSGLVLEFQSGEQFQLTIKRSN